MVERILGNCWKVLAVDRWNQVEELPQKYSRVLLHMEMVTEPLGLKDKSSRVIIW